MIYKFITKLTIFALLTYSNSYSQSQVAVNVSDSLVSIILLKTKITKKEYNDFWSKTGVKSKEEKMNFIFTMRSNFLPIQEYNKAIWECAEKSWIANREIECPNVKTVSAKLKKILYDSNQEAKFEEVERGFKAIIKASANRIKKDTNQKVTLEDIQNIKDETSRILDRTSIILQPEFVETP
jgi:hypothetical protein